MSETGFHDGNTLAGHLSDLFTLDVTTARQVCPGCGADNVVADLYVWDQGPGVVARCPGCTQVALRMTRHSGALWLDLAGSMIRFPVADL